MKKIITCLMICGVLGLSCKKSILQQLNPNQPTPTGSLVTESGITSFSLGIFEKWMANVPADGYDNVMVLAWTLQTILGDEVYCPYGNYGFRWADQAYSVTFPNGTVVINPNGIEQKAQLQALNSRQAADKNVFMYEWEVNYFIISQANLLSKALDNPALHFSGDAVTKMNTLKAWALWWKGYAYSRIGSLYLSAVINNSAADGTTSSAFVAHAAIIEEANKNFDACIAILTSLQDNADYQDLMNAIIPSVFRNAAATNDFKNGDITPAMWVRQIYTYEARNLLVNKKVKTMTDADWTALLALTDKGLQPGDNVFVYALDPNLVNDLNGQFIGSGSPYTFYGDANEFIFTSERLIQDFKPGDARLAKGFTLLDPVNWSVNERGRGLQFGTRYSPVSIEDGGLYATNANVGIINIACTWDENALMAAEAKIRMGTDIDGGLALIDAVRVAQNAGLAAVAGTGITQAQAIEELRRERRVGLFLRGTAFYDARRWGITEPVSAGGGRTNAIVVVPGSLTGTAAPQALSCTIDYRYMDYLDVPQNELDFNAPAAGSAPIKN